ncbi:helix-turn-helix domain-containing protein [Streptomyces sp. x-45]|uniref:helix-turn-helix domain-containing protein n=1 Tax=Streptomyces sp. x-45 TaxID=2789281 RepID=UPI0022C87F98|nr:helix-turn-helix domain-containing protein [Streptomyces diastatochromogenes]
MPKKVQITGAARSKLAADFKKKYDAGASVRAIAEEQGKSYGFVHTLLGEALTTMRGRGGALRKETA